MAARSSTLLSLVAYGLEHPEWAEDLARALGHAERVGKEAQDPTALLAQAGLAPETLTDDLVSKLEDEALYHSIQTVLDIVGDIDARWIG